MQSVLKEQKLNSILTRIPDRFLLSLAVAKRARQLKESGAIDSETPPILAALDEIYLGKVFVVVKEKRKSSQSILEDMEAGAFEDLAENAQDLDKKPKEKPKAKTRSLGA